jgi:hypothetical protein
MLMPIDPDWDEHATEYGEVRSWINSPAGQPMKTKKPDGFRNVHLHGMAHKNAIEDEQAKNAPQAPPKPRGISFTL